MPILTLTTDWHQQDFYLAALKGKILSVYPEATIVDISHQIQVFNLAQAAFILRNSFPYFPEGSVHFIGVKVLPSPGRGWLMAKAGGHFFVAADNGIFGLMLPDGPEQIVGIPLKDPPDKPPLDQVIEIAGMAAGLLMKQELSGFGKQVSDFDKRTPIRATIDESVINGSVIYIDSYRNAITNITAELFERVSKNRPYEILIQSNYFKIRSISRTYTDAPEGEMLAFFNSLGLLEVAIHNGNAADLLNLSVGSTVRVRFSDKKF